MDFKEKFVGYIDICGFKKMVESAEAGNSITLTYLLDLLSKFGSHEKREKLGKDGPSVCPQSNYLQRNLDFRLIQISDCVIVSTEVSPAGVINLVNHCWKVVFSFLQEGVICRGYITRGPIYHTDTQIIGTAFQRAYGREKVVAFRQEADEEGTPFVEVDRAICNYVAHCQDQCVIEMFSRYVVDDGEVVALFPFKRLVRSFIVAGLGQKFAPAKERRSNKNLRLMIEKFKRRIMEFVDTSDPNAVRKAEHYINALDAQLAVCDWTDEMIARMSRLL